MLAGSTAGSRKVLPYMNAQRLQCRHTMLYHVQIYCMSLPPFYPCCHKSERSCEDSVTHAVTKALPYPLLVGNIACVFCSHNVCVEIFDSSQGPSVLASLPERLHLSVFVWNQTFSSHFTGSDSQTERDSSLRQHAAPKHAAAAAAWPSGAEGVHCLVAVLVHYMV